MELYISYTKNIKFKKPDLFDLLFTVYFVWFYVLKLSLFCVSFLLPENVEKNKNKNKNSYGKDAEAQNKEGLIATMFGDDYHNTFLKQNISIPNDQSRL